MGIKIGNSYVSESAMSYAQSQNEKSKSNDSLSSLSNKFKDVKFKVGTAPFSDKGTNNISISPNILRQMNENPDKRLEYEALIYDCQRELKSSSNRSGLSAQGFIIDSDGGLRKWSISKGSDDKPKRLLLNMTEEEFKQRLSGRLPDKELAKEQSNLEKLKSANEYLKSREDELGFQGGRAYLDKDGNVVIESTKATVTFNESKRATQLSAAKNSNDLNKLMKLLQEDLKDCENGLQNNMCDEAEVKKVQKMIERVQSRMNELKDESGENNLSSIDLLI